jgi:hypothetical protein
MAGRHRLNNKTELPTRAKSISETTGPAGRETFCRPRGPASAPRKGNPFGFSMPEFHSVCGGQSAHDSEKGRFDKVISTNGFKKFTNHLQNYLPVQ